MIYEKFGGPQQYFTHHLGLSLTPGLPGQCGGFQGSCPLKMFQGPPSLERYGLSLDIKTDRVLLIPYEFSLHSELNSESGLGKVFLMRGLSHPLALH